MSAHDRMIGDLSNKMSLDIADVINRTMSLIDSGEDQATIIIIVMSALTPAMACKLSEAGDDASSPEEILDEMIREMKIVLGDREPKAA